MNAHSVRIRLATVEIDNRRLSLSPLHSIPLGAAGKQQQRSGSEKATTHCDESHSVLSFRNFINSYSFWVAAPSKSSWRDGIYVLGRLTRWLFRLTPQARSPGITMAELQCTASCSPRNVNRRSPGKHPFVR